MLRQHKHRARNRETANSRLYVCLLCPLTKFEGGLNLLHKADVGEVIWLESTAENCLLCD